MKESMQSKEPCRASRNISLEELRKQEPQFSWKIWLAWLVSISAIYAAFAISDGSPIPEEDQIIFLALAPLQGLLAATFYYGGYVQIRKWSYRRMMKRVSADSLDERAETLQDDLEQDFFNNLVKINFKYIDRYYLQTQIQADKSFLMSAAAAFVGLGIIAAGIVLMYRELTNPAYVTTAAGLLCEGIAALFFYLYNQTIVKMADYHQKLVLTQNISLALRITQDLPEAERVKAQAALVDRLTYKINSYLVGPWHESSEMA